MIGMTEQQIISKNATVNGRQLVIKREDLGPGYWTAASDKGIHKYLTVMNADQQYCTCPDFQYRSRVCKHMKRAMEVD